MQRIRRFVMVAAILLGGVTLAGCQSQPGTAAYVGDTRITDSQVESLVATIQADIDKSHPGSTVPAGDLREIVVEHSVFNELAKRYAAEKGIAVAHPDYKAASDQIGLPADDPYVRLSADEDAYRTALLSKVTPVQPTEADIRAVYDKVTKVVSNVGPYEQVRPAIVALPSLAPALGLRAALSDAANRYDVGVSPRYQPLELALTMVGTNPSVAIVTLPVGKVSGSPAVRDVT